MGELCLALQKRRTREEIQERERRCKRYLTPVVLKVGSVRLDVLTEVGTEKAELLKAGY